MNITAEACFIESEFAMRLHVQTKDINGLPAAHTLFNYLQIYVYASFECSAPGSNSKSASSFHMQMVTTHLQINHGRLKKILRLINSCVGRRKRTLIYTVNLYN